eukprot:IDg22438t1
MRNTKLGAAGSPFLVLAGAPQTQRASGHHRPHPRVVSNELALLSRGGKPNRRGMSELVMYFGQFVDHTITKTSVTKIAMPMKAPASDKIFSGECLPFNRTRRMHTHAGWAPVNGLSSFIDAGSIYATLPNRADHLRKFKKGMMDMSVSNMLPVDRHGMYVSGDSRVNENPGLTVMHTLLFREHNRAAREVKAYFPRWRDSVVYNVARRIVIAQLQAIVFFDFLPAVLGKDLPAYKGYRPDVDPRIADEFSTAAYRVGHSMINAHVTLREAAG